NIPLKNLKNFSADQKLETQINTGGSISPAEGIVAYIIDELDGVDQVGRILIKINNDEYLFKPGMHVKVVLP
ncbi:MAG: hypothetical protein HQ517_18490, partial [SAR324 cluster bacterium]|nr:hypothetical protein [SAR324 cluster bacterium]